MSSFLYTKLWWVIPLWAVKGKDALHSAVDKLSWILTEIQIHSAVLCKQSE